MSATLNFEPFARIEELEKRVEALEAALREIADLASHHGVSARAFIDIANAALAEGQEAAPTETHCDICGKAFKPDDDVVLMGERGNYHQACFLSTKEQDK